ncbi:MAG: C2 domain-containing protein [Kofleriaceae bacterium]
MVATACGGDGGGDGDGDGTPDAPAGSCGNGTCEVSETATSCSADCSVADCGNGTCGLDESSTSCPQDCEAECGNGVCEAGETTSSCAEDCATASCTADPLSCTGETVCIAGTCENAFGRNYRIKVVSAVFTEKKGNGDAWDVGGGLPDGKVTVTVNGTAVTTPVVNDTLTPTWNFLTGPTLIPGGTNLKIEVLDDDVAADDLGWVCINNPLTADLIRAGARCSGTGPLATARVDLQFAPI